MHTYRRLYGFSRVGNVKTSGATRTAAALEPLSFQGATRV